MSELEMKAILLALEVSGELLRDSLEVYFDMRKVAYRHIYTSMKKQFFSRAQVAAVFNVPAEQLPSPFSTGFPI